MTQLFTALKPLSLVFLLLWATAHLDGQDVKQDTPPALDPLSSQGEPSFDETIAGKGVPQLAVVEGYLSKLDSDNTIDEAAKEKLVNLYQQAIGSLGSAKTSREQAEGYRNAVTRAPQTTEKIQEEIEALSTPEQLAEKIRARTIRNIQQAVDTNRTLLRQLNESLADEQDDQKQLRQRGLAIVKRLPAAEDELDATVKRLSELVVPNRAKTPFQLAERIATAAAKDRLVAEINMLKQEQLSQTVREDLAEAKVLLANRRVLNQSAVVEVLEGRLLKQRSDEVSDLKRQLAKLSPGLPDNETTKKMLKEVQSLIGEFESSVAESRETVEIQGEISDRLKQLSEDEKVVNGQLALGGSSDLRAGIIFDLLARLGSQGSYSISGDVKIPDLEDVRRDSLVIDRLLLDTDGQQAAADRVGNADWQALLAMREKILKMLKTHYRGYLPALVALEQDRRDFKNKVAKLRSQFREQLFWIRSHPRVSWTTFRDFSPALKSEFSRTHWDQAVGALVSAWNRYPGICIAWWSLGVGLLVLRRWMISLLEWTGRQTKRISTDRMSYTIGAFGLTLLLVAPLPLGVSFFWWAFGLEADGNDWLKGLRNGVRLSTWVSSLIGLVIVICRKDGLGVSHFRWPITYMQQIRRCFLGFLLVFVPTLLVLCSTVFENPRDSAESIGRFSFLLAQILTIGLVLNLFIGRDGVFKSVHSQSQGFKRKLILFLFVSLLVVPIGLFLLAWFGYLVTAMELSFGLLGTVGLIFCGEILFWLALRWFGLKARHLKLAEALEMRKARQEAAEEVDSVTDGLLVDVHEEDRLNLVEVGQQTQQVLRMLFAVSVGGAVLLFWSGSVPLIPILDKTVPFSGYSLLSLFKAILIFVMTWFTVKNLPGLMELSGLRSAIGTAGTRYAIITIAQYSVMAIGATLFFNALETDWSKFGWIAAALSVGLGFGLQEVVANFVCGLILLFERPIRVGDVVSIEGVTGRVTRIRMRATTISNWDRQEFVVPNKQLITGTILNWTLTADVNRLTVPIGIAYGANTEQAREIMVRVAQNHPLVLKEPAPAADFEEFGDSALLLCLRVFVAGVESRLAITTALNTEINKRFEQAKIEIAFPQLDVNLKTSEPKSL